VDVRHVDVRHAIANRRGQRAGRSLAREHDRAAPLVQPERSSANGRSANQSPSVGTASLMRRRSNHVPAGASPFSTQIYVPLAVLPMTAGRVGALDEKHASEHRIPTDLFGACRVRGRALKRAHQLERRNCRRTTVATQNLRPQETIACLHAPRSGHVLLDPAAKNLLWPDC
jgi:hypothetical protein